MVRFWSSALLLACAACGRQSSAVRCDERDGTIVCNVAPGSLTADGRARVCFDVVYECKNGARITRPANCVSVENGEKKQVEFSRALLEGEQTCDEIDSLGAERVEVRH